MDAQKEVSLYEEPSAITSMTDTYSARSTSKNNVCAEEYSNLIQGANCRDKELFLNPVLVCTTVNADTPTLLTFCDEKFSDTTLEDAKIEDTTLDVNTAASPGLLAPPPIIYRLTPLHLGPPDL